MHIKLHLFDLLYDLSFINSILVLMSFYKRTLEEIFKRIFDMYHLQELNTLYVFAAQFAWIFGYSLAVKGSIIPSS